MQKAPAPQELVPFYLLTNLALLQQIPQKKSTRSENFTINGYVDRGLVNSFLFLDLYPFAGSSRKYLVKIT